MKRHLLTIAICLLLGAVVNVAVAWGVAFWTESPRTGELAHGEPLSEAQTWKLWQHYARAEWPAPVGGARFFAFGRTNVAVVQEDSRGNMNSVVIEAVGWPARSLQNVLLWSYFEGLGGHELVNGWGLPEQLLRFGWKTGHLPLRPLWPGFAVNTVFFATILWLPFVLRRFSRLRRGLCPKCAYPMGGSAVCTECGNALLPGHSLRG